jgi:hypothetical protein
MAKKRKLSVGDRILYANFKYHWNHGKGSIIKKYNNGPRNTMLDIKMDNGDIIIGVSQVLVRRLPSHLDKKTSV